MSGGQGQVIEKSTKKKKKGGRMANTEPRAQVISNDAKTTRSVSVRRGIFCPSDIQWR